MKDLNDSLTLIAKCALVLAFLVFVLLATSCTMVRYQSEDRTLTVVDLHPGGETLSLQGTLDSIGTLDVNRDTSDSTAVVGTIVEAAVGQ